MRECIRRRRENRRRQIFGSGGTTKLIFLFALVISVTRKFGYPVAEKGLHAQENGGRTLLFKVKPSLPYRPPKPFAMTSWMPETPNFTHRPIATCKNDPGPNVDVLLFPGTQGHGLNEGRGVSQTCTRRRERGGALDTDAAGKPTVSESRHS